jgi:peptidoglycan/xylan/chitin deacetylase (PgdA/CDA1 family)
MFIGTWQKGRNSLQRRRFLYGITGITLGLILPAGLSLQAEGSASAEKDPFTPAAKTIEQAPNTVYLTFDDGNVGLGQKLATLRALAVPATFFLTGQAIKSQPRQIEQLFRDGHRLGNHSWNHRDFTTLDASSIRWQIKTTEAAADHIAAGPGMAPLLRPPNGSVNEQVRKVVAELGYEIVLWDWDTRDWGGAPAAYMEKNFGPGVVLMHTQGPHTVEAVNNAVPSLVAQGHKFGVL